MNWTSLIHLGDISLTFAAAAAITAWLVTVRAWRMAFWWSFVFALGIGLVAASKVAFMAWGTELQVLHFRAFSGHAAGFTAVVPTLLYLLLWQRGARVRRAGVGGGLALGALMAVSLVAAGEHSAAEAASGWAIGALISVAAIVLGGALPARRPSIGLMCSALVFLTAAFVMQSVPVGYVMFRTAAFMAATSARLLGERAAERRQLPTREESTCIQTKYRVWYSKNRPS